VRWEAGGITHLHIRTPPRMDLASLVPVPALKLECGLGYGVAACPELGVFAASVSVPGTVNVYKIVGLTRLEHEWTFGGVDAPPALRFRFDYSESLAFTTRAPHHLFVNDAGRDAVHIIDVMARVHVGYLGVPGSVARPRSVATRHSLAAVSGWTEWKAADHVVTLYQGSGADWVRLRMIGGIYGRRDGQLWMPRGMRFTRDGRELVVVDRMNNRLGVFSTSTGAFVKQLSTNVDAPCDVEEWEGGWVATYNYSHVVGVQGDGSATRTWLGSRGVSDGQFDWPLALAVLPGPGLVVRDRSRIQVFATADAVAMAGMSEARVAWMVVCGRVIQDKCQNEGNGV